MLDGLSGLLGGSSSERESRTYVSDNNAPQYFSVADKSAPADENKIWYAGSEVATATSRASSGLVGVVHFRYLYEKPQTTR